MKVIEADDVMIEPGRLNPGDRVFLHLYADGQTTSVMLHKSQARHVVEMLKLWLEKK